MLLARTKKTSVLPTVGAYGTPFNRIICAGVSKGPLVLRFPFACELQVDDDDDDGDDGGVDRSGDGAGC